MKKLTGIIAASVAALGLAGGMHSVNADNVPVVTAQNINQKSTGQQNVPANEAQTINSARAYLMNTIYNDDSQHMEGDLPTQAQNGPSNWSVVKQSGNSVTIGLNGTPLFTLTNNGNGTSNLDYCNWHFVVRNSDHKILGNVGQVSVPQQNAANTQGQQTSNNTKAQVATNAQAQNENQQSANASQKAVENANETTKNGGVFVKQGAKTLPQTGESSSEVMAIAGGMIIAMTATGVVVYKKRN